MPQNSFTLYELNRQIKSSIEQSFDAPVWLVAEINSINKHNSGHCYLEFIQKSTKYDTIIAKARAMIWSTQYRIIESYFKSITGKELQTGLKIMVKVSVDYHEIYGLSLNVRDIEPTYTLGDLEKRKLQIIKQLEDEGVFYMNKDLELPLVIKNIAVISSSKAAGYEDFIHQINKNIYGYKFNIQLFEATMQGNKTEESVIKAITNIFDSKIDFDLIAILRGGGAKSDLSFFDNYNIAFHITQIPIPVITGIGHDRDESIADMVANTKVKTPTAAANFIIEHNLNFESIVIDIKDKIFTQAQDLIKTNDIYLTNLSLNIHRTKTIINDKIDNCNKLFYRINNTVKNNINKDKNRIKNIEQRITNLPKVYIKQSEIQLEQKYKNIISKTKFNIKHISQKIELYEQNIRLIDPENILKRGYSITRHKGKILKNNTKLVNGDLIETIITGKKIKSIIKK